MRSPCLRRTLLKDGPRAVHESGEAPNWRGYPVASTPNASRPVTGVEIVQPSGVATWTLPLPRSEQSLPTRRDTRSVLGASRMVHPDSTSISAGAKPLRNSCEAGRR
jgi:hypothetical protein